MKPIKIGVYIEKVNVDTATIMASCFLIGKVDNVTKPVRLENLPVSQKARITDRGKEVKLTDLKHLPRDTPFYVFLKAYELAGWRSSGSRRSASRQRPRSVRRGFWVVSGRPETTGFWHTDGASAGIC